MQRATLLAVRGVGSQSPPREDAGAAPQGAAGPTSRDAFDLAQRWAGRILPALGPVLIFLVGAACLRWSWPYGPDSLVDFGRELYVPWRLVEGDVLYRDLVYLNGPLSPYWNALLFEIFGVGLRTLMWGNAVVAAAIAFVLYRLLVAIADRLSATLACLGFVLTLAFTQLSSTANYNFLTPYSHEITHGMLLALLTFYALSLRSRAGIPAVSAAGFCTGLVFLTKPELFVATLAGAAIALLLFFYRERSALPESARELAIFVAATLVPPLAAIALLAFAMPADTALYGPIDPWISIFNTQVSDLEFYRWVLGTDELAANLARMRLWIVRYALLCVPLAVAALAVRRGARWRWFAVAAVFALFLFGTGPGPYLSALGFGSGSPHPPAMRINEWPHSVRALPLALPLVALGALAVLVSRRRAGRATANDALRVAFVVFALALLGKIVFNVRMHHYGFALGLPGIAVLIATMLSWIPRLIDRYGGFGAVFSAGCLGLLLAAAPDFVNITEHQFAKRVYPVGAQSDRMLGGRKASFVATALREVERRVGPGETLAVIPEGVMFNYLARRAASTPHNNFMPPELIIYGEDRILRDFRAAPPDYILVVHKDTTEYGFPLFGQDYAQRLYAWVNESYTPVYRTGRAPLVDVNQFGIALLKRKAGDQSPSTGG